MQIRDAVLDLLGCGVVVYCRCGQQTYANSLAERILSDDSLNSLIHKVVSGAMRRSFSGGLDFVGPEIVEAAHDDCLDSLLLSVAKVYRDPVGCPDTEEFVCRIVDLNHGVSVPPAILANAFNLSSRESEVASRMLRPCESDQDIARSIGVSLNTVKSHIKKIYLKTGSNSRGELVRKLMMVHMVAPAAN